MTRREIKARTTFLILVTRPHPYLVSLLFVILLQAIGLISMQVGGQPFTMDMSAMASGDAANAVRFTPENITIPTTLILLALEVAAALLRFGFNSFCLNASRMSKPSYYDLMDGFMLFFKASAVWLITTVMAYVGMLLLIVPGFIIVYTYSMAPRLLLDHPDWGVFRVLAESRRIMRGHRIDFFMLRLSLIGWTILCAFPVTAVFAEPYLAVCESVFYLDLTVDPSLKTSEGQSPEDKPPWEY